MKIINRWLWAIFGIIFSFSVAMMLVGGSFSLDCFYDQGEICEIVGTDLELEGSNFVHVNGVGTHFTITEDIASRDYVFYGNKWKYLLFEISDLSVSELPVTLTYMSLKGKVRGEQQIILKEGWNTIEPIKKKFGVVRMNFQNCKGESLSVDAAITRMELSRFSGKKLVHYGGLILVLYCAISAVIALCIKKLGKHRHNYAQLGMDYYLRFLEWLYSVLQKIPIIRWSEKKKHYLRIFCVLAEILYTTVAVNIDRMRILYGVSLGFHVLFIILLAILMVGPKTKKLQWNTGLGYIWMVLCIAFCVSDLIVAKVFTGVGYVFLLVFGLFFYCWRQMECPEQLLKEIGVAVQISFVCVVVFCVFCRPFVEGTRYAGCFINPNPFGRYLVVVCIVAFAQVEYMVREGLVTWKKTVLYGIEMDLLCYFVWQTKSRGALLAIVILLIFMLMRMINLRTSVSMFRGYMRILCITAVGLFPVMFVTETLLCNLPYLLHTQVQWKKDVLHVKNEEWFHNPFIDEVYASASNVISSVQTRSLDAVSSGRITYWKAYLRNMNLWGHEFRCEINGGIHSAHNMFLDIAYRYGVLVAGIYVVFWGTLIKEAGHALMQKSSYSFIAAGCIVGYFGMALLDTLEQPWVYLLWALAYMSMGYYLFEDNEKKE